MKYFLGPSLLICLLPLGSQVLLPGTAKGEVLADRPGGRENNIESEASKRFMNLKLSPLAASLGIFNVEADFNVGANWAFGGTFLSWSRQTTDPNFYGPLSLTLGIIGIRATHFSSGVYRSSFYLSPIAEVITANISGTTVIGRNVTGTVSGAIVQVLFGYHWFWSYFNVSLGAGPSLTLGADKISLDDGVSKSQVVISNPTNLTLATELMIGITF